MSNADDLISPIPETPTSRNEKGEALYEMSESQRDIALVTTLNAKKTRSGRLRKPPTYLTDNYYHGEIDMRKVNKKIKERTEKKKQEQKKSLKASATSDPTATNRQTVTQRQQDRRQTTVEKKRASTKKAPPANLVWDFNSNGTGAGIFVNTKFCFIGNSNGYVYALDPDTAQVKHQMKFDAGVKCIVGDRGFLYVGLANGAVYDCTTGTPRLAYQLDPTSSIEWMDIHDGLIAMDQSGTAVVLNIEGEVVWENKGVGRNRFARTDGARMYHCRQDQVTAYRFADGKELWSVPGGGYVTFGAQDEKYLYTAPLETRALDKETGKLVKQYQNCVPWACTVSDKHVYASDCGSKIVCYDKDTTEMLWSVKTGSGKGVSMQYHEGHDRLYVVTEGGHMLCYDVSGNAVEKKIETSSDSQSSDTVAVVPETELKTTDDCSWGVLLVCVKDEKGKLRVRVDPSVPGYDHSLNVQFPRNMRQEGQKFVCTELVKAANGGYYRAKGDIEKYVPSTD